MFLRHIPFLKAVFAYSLTAFGGPQGHIGMMVKTFVRKRKDVTEEELIEYNSFCQMLPGPSSTQTVMLIGWKRGGIPLAIVTLLIWILPATLLMSAFSFLVYFLDTKSIQQNLFLYVRPMSVGFVCYAAINMMQRSVSNKMTLAIMIGGGILTVLIRSPWLFPVLLLIAGILTNFSNKRIVNKVEKPKPVKWINLLVFALVFIAAGVVSEIARHQQWEHRRIVNLFENFYRFGSIVFGGGQALIPMMLVQFVSLPAKRGFTPYMTPGELMTGFGLVQAMPGPVFSVCAFVGGLAMSKFGPVWQAAGCLVSIIAIFLPSTLLLLFLFPVYQNLKQHVVIYRSLEGINAVIVGVIWASGIILFMEINRTGFDFMSLVVVIITFCLLQFTRIPAPLIVLGWLLLGWTLH
ncbi:chromate efflux transporter [Taibaiella koreensis]|uniref:chromate efflux transporter n=1 Tax=Taibaiella koreensis TaxID=1268548 RepID=UPI000E59ECA3|nr:chromate efflux transporter [Taibaiella koreensis]